MTKRDYQNLLKNRFQRLVLINQYLEDFEEALGKNGVKALIDETLDDINYLRKKLKEFDN